MTARNRIILFGLAIVGPLAFMPLLAVDARYGLAAVGVVGIVWLAARSVAIPVGMIALPDIVVGVLGHSPFPPKASAYFTVGWTALALLCVLLRDAKAFQLRVFASGQVVATLGLVVLMVARLGGSTDPTYGSYKLQLFVAGSVVALFAGAVIARRARDLELYAVLVVVMAMTSALVLTKQILQGTADATTGGRLALYADANPIELGRAAAIGITVGLFLILAGGPLWRRILATAAVPLLVVALLSAGSRGPMLGLVVGVLVLVGFTVRDPAVRKRLGLVAAGVLPALLLVPALVPGQNLTRSLSVLIGGGGSTTEGGLDPNGRFALFGDAWHAFSAHPFFGIGTGSFASIGGGELYPHNIVMEAGAEYGILGAVLVVTFLVLAFRSPLRAWRVADGPDRRRAALVLALLSAAIVNAFVSGSLENAVGVWLAAGLGLGLAPDGGRLKLPAVVRRKGAASPEPPPPALPPKRSLPGLDRAGGSVTSPAPGSLVRGRVNVTATPAETGYSVRSLTLERSADGYAWIEIGPAEDDGSFDVFLVSRGQVARRRHIGLVHSREAAEQLKATLEAEHEGGPERVELAQAKGWSGGDKQTVLWDTTEAGDGTWRLRSITVDVDGRRVISPEISVSVDNTAPLVSVDRPAAGSVLIRPTQVEVSARDATSEIAEVRIECSNGNGWQEIAVLAETPHRALWSVDTVQQGDYELRAVALDAAGNSAVSAPVRVRVERVESPVDLAPLDPVLTGRAILRAEVGEDALEWLELQAAPAGTLDWRTLARLEERPFAVALDTTSLPDGAYDFRAVAGRKDGRVEASRPQRARRIDNTPPVIELREPPAGSWLRGEVALAARASDAGSGLRSLLFQFSSGGHEWRPVMGDQGGPAGAVWDTTKVPDGRYLLRAVAGDDAGNLGASEPVAVNVDNTPPSATISRPSPGAVLGGVVSVSADAGDDGSGLVSVRIEVATDTQSWWELGTLSAAPFVLRWDTGSVPDGRYRLRCAARDRIGNSSFGDEVQVVVANNGAPAAAPPPPVATTPAPPAPVAATPVAPTPLPEPTPLAALTLWQLERLLVDGDPRRDEREALLYSLRMVTRPDGTIPEQFHALVRETFGDLLPWS